MQTYHLRILPLAALVSLAMLSIVAAQSPASKLEWETLRPEKEQFSVLIPKGSTFEEASKVPYHKMELNTRFYISRAQGGPVFAVVSLSGIKSNPAAYSEMQRLNSYVDAFKTLFVPKIRDKAGLAQLTLVRERGLRGNPGREYRLTIGNLSGIAHVYATSRRFYAITYLDTKKDEAIQEQFLSSFVIPEKLPGPATAVAENYAAPRVRAEVMPSTSEGPPAAKKDDNQNPDEAARKDENQKHDENATHDAAAMSDSKPQRAPISGGVLNGKAINLPAPEYPAIARQAKASGAVTVKVMIDENGAVISAQAVSGHPLLQAAAVAAARQARFSPTLLMGEPVKVTGVIVYNFGEP